MIHILWTFSWQKTLATKTVEHTIHVGFTAMRAISKVRRVTGRHHAGSPQVRMFKVDPSFLVVNHVHAMSRDMLISRAYYSTRGSLTKELRRVFKTLTRSFMIHVDNEVVPGSPHIRYFPHFVRNYDVASGRFLR